ncbi:MAG: hypothetical protein LUH22_19495 [Bacteroides sp.]|nr:hypothetical protein [Bacteroides sp.]
MNLLKQQKRHLFLFMLTVFLIHTVSAQQKIRHNESIKKFLKEHCIYRDPNPTCQADADTINHLFTVLLNKQLSAAETQRLRSKVFSLLYDNSVYVFEDAVDIERIKQKQYLCYLCLSLLADSNRNLTFIENARNCFNEDNYYREKALIDLTEIFLMLEEESLYKNEIDQRIITLYNSTFKNKNKFSDNVFVTELCRILKATRKIPQTTPVKTTVKTTVVAR